PRRQRAAELLARPGRDGRRARPAALDDSLQENGRIFRIEVRTGSRKKPTSCAGNAQVARPDGLTHPRRQSALLIKGVVFMSRINSSWWKRLFATSQQRTLRRLAVESLEDRTVPCTDVWGATTPPVLANPCD